MKVYTAEDSAGEIYLIRGAIDAGGKAAREDFANAALALLVTFPKDERTARELTLLEWENEQSAGAWLLGDGSVAPERWPDMARKAEFGKIVLEYPGDYVIVIEDGEVTA